MKELLPDKLRYFLLALIAFALGASLLNSKPTPKTAAPGTPRITTEFPDLKLGTQDQILEVGDRLYVCQSSQGGIVQVYSLSGEYIQTMSFATHSNGGFFLACEGQSLYVRDMKDNVYVFEQGQFSRYLPEKQAETELSHINFYSKGSTPGYEVRWGSLWHVTKDGEICLIPAEHRLVDYLDLIVVGICFIAVTATVLIRHIREKHREAYS